MVGVLEDRVAIVTGSDSGIGRATAMEMATAGADVAVTYLHDGDGAKATCREVEQCGRRGLICQFDHTNPDAVAGFFEQVDRGLGTPYVLVNNAGIDSTGKEIDEMTDAEWDREIRTNLYGPFYCAREFIRRRRDAGGHGKMLNITSIHQEIPRAGAGAYDAAKGALRNLTRTLCLELASDRINVNNIAPGMVLTPFNQAAVEDPGVCEEQARNIPWGRAAEPNEVAKLAVYLASEAADYITGQTFTIDGGLTMNMGQGA